MQPLQPCHRYMQGYIPAVSQRRLIGVANAVILASACSLQNQRHAVIFRYEACEFQSLNIRELVSDSTPSPGGAG